MKKAMLLSMLVAVPAFGAPEVVRFDPSMPFELGVDRLRATDIDPAAPDIELFMWAAEPGGGSNASVWHPQIIGYGWLPFGTPDALEVESSIFNGSYLSAGVVVPTSTPGPWGVADRDVYYGAGPGNYSLESIAYEYFPFKDTCLSCTLLEDFLSIDPGVHYIALRWEQESQTHYGWVAFEFEQALYPEHCINDDGFSCDGRDLESLRQIGELRYLALGWETDPDTSIVIGGGLCRTDMNFDTVIDFFDVSSYISSFAAGDLVADYTGDGSLDFFDVSAFITEFGGGCDF